jgi:hypothetical protein
MPCTGPVVFFRRDYAFRTLNGTMAVIAALLASALSGAVAVYAWKTGEGVLVHVVAAVFASGALIFCGLGLWATWSWIGNRRVHVEINGDGIICGDRIWPWDRVHRFVGRRYSNGICLEFTLSRGVVLGGGHLPTTPLLTDKEYVELARTLDQCISARFPHVVVAMEPEDATADP